MKKILQLFIILLTLIGCQKNDINSPSDENLLEEVVSVPITLGLPHPSQFTTRTTAALIPDLETHIEKICIAIFEAPAPSAAPSDKLLQLIDGNQTLIDDNKVQALLNEYTGDYRLLAIANYSDNFNTQLTALKVDFENGTATYGQFTSLTEDLTAIYVGGDASAGQIKVGGTENLTGSFPMYSVLYSGTDIIHTTNITLPLTNSYSRITIDASSIALTTYTILGASLLQGAKTASYNPSAPLSISTLSDGAIPYLETDAVDNIPNTLINHVSPIYLFPNNGDNGANPTDIIIEGNYTDAKDHTYTGFHKIRIQHANYDILPNTLYRVLISKINSAGYASFAEAQLAEPNSDVLYDVIVDDTTSMDLVTGNGSYYLGFSNSNFTVYNDDALNNTIATTFNYDLSPGAVTAGITLPSPEISVTGSGLSLSNPTASYTPNSSNHIEVNMTSGFTSGTIIFRLGNIAHSVNVLRNAALSAAASPLNDFATDDYVYGRFDNLASSSWLSFTNDPTNSSISSDTGGIPLSLDINSTGAERTSTPLYLSRKDGKGRTKIIITQN